MNRFAREKMAKDTLEYIETKSKDKVSSIYYESEELKKIKQKNINAKEEIKTEIDVRCQDVVWTVIKEDGPITVLNFASAKNPGGGWLNGSQAQEEAIARSSTMYQHIKDVHEFYKNPKHHKNGFYDSDIIYSENISMIKNPSDKYFDNPIPFNMITSCAVNVSALPNANKDEVYKAMKERIENIIEVAILNDTKTLVLGAFGTGVFKNPPMEVARIFKEVIHSERYRNKIPKIIFSIVGENYLVDIFKVVKTP